MSNTKALPPSLVAVLIEQAVANRVKPASLVANVQAAIPITYRETSAAFTKEAPGVYEVKFYRDAQEVGSVKASSPVEAKLLVLDHVIEAARKVA